MPTILSAAALYRQESKVKEVTWIDGKELHGFIIAKEHLSLTLEPAEKPFLLHNYSVGFLGDGKYIFSPKPAPGEKPALGWESELGYLMQVDVDLKTGKVISSGITP